MKAVILAGGLGSRLWPFTQVIPKPLLPLGEGSVMETQLLHLKSHGFEDVYLATNYKSEYMEAFIGDGSKFGVNIKYSREEKALGTCGPLALLKEELDEPFVVMNGDILTKVNLTQLYGEGLKNDTDLTVGTKIIITPFRFSNIKVDEKGYLKDIEEKPSFEIEILAGIYFMRPEIFSYIPDDEFYGMDMLIRDIMQSGKNVSRYLIKEYWVDIGVEEDYEQARETYTKHFGEKK